MSNSVNPSWFINVAVVPVDAEPLVVTGSDSAGMVLKTG